MNTKYSIFSLFSLCFLSVLFLLPLPALAKNISLYEAPKDDSKVVGTIDPAIGVIPIISNKEGTWMKVGDPQNGNVGWIKTSDIGNGASGSFSFTQRTINNGNGPQSYQIIQYGKPQDLSSDQMKETVKKMQSRQKLIEQNLQSSIQNMIHEINEIYKEQSAIFGNMPLIMPIVVIPAQPNNPSKKQNEAGAKKATSKPDTN